MPGPQSSESKLDELLRTAIEHRRLIRLVYRSKDRIVEPHDYGIHNGSVKLLAYQVGGSSSGKLPNWRLMDAELISDVQLLDQTFAGGRPTSTGKHYKWDKLFIRVKPAGKNSP
jgi:predicted DNA-binding transcriptional regulator YafY